MQHRHYYNLFCICLSEIKGIWFRKHRIFLIRHITLCDSFRLKWPLLVDHVKSIETIQTNAFHKSKILLYAHFIYQNDYIPKNYYSIICLVLFSPMMYSGGTSECITFQLSNLVKQVSHLSE